MNKLVCKNCYSPVGYADRSDGRLTHVYGQGTIDAGIRCHDSYTSAQPAELPKPGSIVSAGGKELNGRNVQSAKVYSTAVAAAKAYAKAHDHVGRQGGWIYNSSGRPICQGWASYTSRLVHQGRLRNFDGTGMSTTGGGRRADGSFVRNPFNRHSGPVLLVEDGS